MADAFMEFLSSLTPDQLTTKQKNILKKLVGDTPAKTDRKITKPKVRKTTSKPRKKSVEPELDGVAIIQPKSNKKEQTVAKCGKVEIGPRPNRFETDSFFDEAKERTQKDTEIDKLLWGNRRPTERDRDTRVQSECRHCGKKEYVSSVLCLKDEEKRVLMHACAKCSGGKRK